MDVVEIIERMERFEQERTNWDSRWQDCADYGMPQNNQITRKKAPGQKASVDLFDTTAEESINQLAAGLYSYLFPAEGQAFVLEIDDPDLQDDDDTKQWLDKTTKTLHKYLVSSNFRDEFGSFLKSWVCFGTSTFYEEKGKKTPINFVNHFVASIYIAKNSDGEVDTVYRSFEYTARQAVQEFGEENLSEKIKTAYKENKDKKFPFIHAVFPREEYDTSKDDPTNMPFASIYVSRSDKTEISNSGYPEFPFQVCTFDNDALEDYGRSPMMKKLPDIKMANQMQKIRIKGWDKQVDPTILLKDDGSIWPLASKPGGVIFYQSEKPSYWEFKGDLNGMEAAILTVQQTIQKGFFLDMFDPLIDRQNMTATEVMARIEQKMRFLIPIISRLQSGLLNPMINRMIGILTKQGKLLEMPEALSEKEFSVQYLGRIALSIQTLEVEGLTQLLLDWAPLAELSNHLDNLDTDIAFRDSARNRGVPATWLKDKKLVQTERQAAAEAQQQQALMQQIPDLSKAAKNLSTAPEEGSPASELMNSVK